jgi:uncharacterized protein
MTPQERELVTALFERLTALESHPRDPEAERLIAQGSAQAPHAIYPLVQTVLLQDEALKRANARIEELEGKAGEAQGSFLDAARGTVPGGSTGGARNEGRGSVPSVRPGGVWNTGQTGYGTTPQPMPGPMSAPMSGPMGGAGGSFLGTAAAAAVGMIGGSLLFNGIRGLMGGGTNPSAFGGLDAAGPQQSPWGGGASGSDLARDAGLNDVGSGRGEDTRSAGLFDDSYSGQDANDADYDDVADNDFGGDDGTSEA